MRDIRNRMKSVRQSLQVTSAMKLISTAKLRRARRRLDETLPYFTAIREVMHDIEANAEAGEEKWFDRRASKPGRKVATLVITADKGLAGGYNHSIIRFAEERCPPGSILMPLGAVGKRYFIERDYILLEDFAPSAKEPTVYEAEEVANFAASQYLSGRVDEFRVIFTRMYSTVKLEPEMITLLPLDLEAIRAPGHRLPESVVYSYEPNESALFDVLVPQYLKGIVYGALVQAFASEQAARMTAMDSASKNADKLLGRLQLVYNRARQASITSEVSEIVAGASALED